ncbi:hypothetical protein OCU04_010771 [Sclerotinia nivalis]|uniref:Uncharacterized protein n=1 Tax=Sclerotinia nivalis TaxID=352851 RepID=A0A9X0ACX1_9HELO|nr:hypothetical protein OCU04_010771 [Sclerotinia nivalis]
MGTVRLSVLLPPRTQQFTNHAKNRVESNLVVIASSVPLIRPLFIRLKSGDFSTSATTRPAAPTFELSGYSGKRKSLQINRVFS